MPFVPQALIQRMQGYKKAERGRLTFILTRAIGDAFVARDVPALGYTVYHAIPNVAGPPEPPVQFHKNAFDTTRDDYATIENEFYRTAFNLWTGEMTSLMLKENDWEALAKPGNVVAREYDGGDFWELSGTLNGVRFTAMKKEIPPPRPAMTQWSSDFVGGSGGLFLPVEPVPVTEIQQPGQHQHCQQFQPGRTHVAHFHCGQRR